MKAKTVVKTFQLQSLRIQFRPMSEALRLGTSSAAIPIPADIRVTHFNNPSLHEVGSLDSCPAQNFHRRAYGNAATNAIVDEASRTLSDLNVRLNSPDGLCAALPEVFALEAKVADPIYAECRMGRKALANGMGSIQALRAREAELTARAEKWRRKLENLQKGT
jgi:hypothetical protein